MKIVFIKDIHKVGKKNEIKEVADGYGKFLIASGAAVAAHDGAVKIAIDAVARKEAQKEKTVEEFRVLSQKLQSTVLKTYLVLNEKGHLFQAVRESDIASLIEEQIGIKVATKMIHIGSPIKEKGVHVFVIKQGTMHGEGKIEVLEKK